jgi:hypothetical protein
MSTIPFITTDKDLFARVTRIACSGSGVGDECVSLKDPKESLEFLNVEMPDLIFVDFSDPTVQAHKLMSSITKDPWLLHGGIIALCADYDTIKKVEEYRGANIVISLIADEIEKHLPKIVDIINNNRRILFQRAIGADFVSTISGSFHLHNDPIEASCYANLVCNFLFNANRIDVDRKTCLNLALNEMLMNAIEHGNCGVTYEEKSQWLESGKMMYDLIETKCKDASIGQRKVLFEYTIVPAGSTFVIADEGAGFDWRNLKDASKEENLLELHGRGIFLTKRFTKNLRYNEPGNQVSFEIEHITDKAILTPGLFEHMEPVDIRAGDVVFSQGESSDFLYYIAKGRYDVVVNDTVVSSLSADDIFMGEMSFLLNHRRSAAVRAHTDGQLIRISKKDFVEAVKKKPHYALFLARLLAQRIQRGNVTRAAQKT